jgi:hypothetical protein
MAFARIGATNTFSPMVHGEPSRVLPEPAVDTAAAPTYAQDIAPLFELRCVKCHGSPFARNDLRLSTYANVMRGGETGTAVIPGDPEGSLLLKKVEGRDKPSMPPRRPLSKAEKELLRRWIAAGAPP